MRCDILCIGDELLIGQVINTNAAWIGRELTGIGYSIRQTMVVADDKDAIVEALKNSIVHADWVFVTGGLGPTKDDMTRDALLTVFGGELVFHEETWNHVEKIFRLYGKELTDKHRAQSYFPSSAEILSNKMGTAPGLLFHTSHCRTCVMPGVPFEMEYIMQTHVLPMLLQQDAHGMIYYQTICTVGEGETFLSQRIADIEDNLPDQIRLAYLPSPGRVRLRITGSGTDRKALIHQVNAIADSIAGRIKEFIYSREDISLAEAIGRTMNEQGKRLSVAESCTGGFLGHLITATADASKFFEGGAITYSNALKQSVLGVPAEVLEKHGAVSEETVRAMASGACRVFNTACAIAVSGIAGPGGGTPEKPVGTVWICVRNGENETVKKFTFGKDRLRNIELSAVNGLNMLRKALAVASPQ